MNEREREKKKQLLSVSLHDLPLFSFVFGSVIVL